jgi:hypothetical protein
MKTIQLNPRETKTIFLFINLTGKVFLKIGNRSQSNKITCWWVKGPFGSVENLGDISGSAVLEFKGLIWGKLRASGADSETVIIVTENASIAASFPDIHF